MTNPGIWWTAPSERERRLAYWRCLRIHYEMSALDAWHYMKRAWGEYPEFFADPIGTLRQAINPGTHEARAAAMITMTNEGGAP